MPGKSYSNQWSLPRLRRQGHRSQNTATSAHHYPSTNRRVSDGSTSSSDSTISLEFVTEPPREVQRGYPIHNPVTLRVRTESDPQAEPINQYFAIASLVTSDGDATATPQGALTGPKLADSIHAPEYQTSSRSDVMGYFSFPYLQMQSSGSYRLRVTLMKIDGRGAYEQSAVALQAVDSGNIQVTGDSQRYQAYY